MVETQTNGKYSMFWFIVRKPKIAESIFSGMGHSGMEMEPSKFDAAVHWAVQLYGPYFSKTEHHRVRVMISASLLCDWYMVR